MPKTPKEGQRNEKEKPLDDLPDSWVEDQKRHDYYYDDAHGYVVYRPKNDSPDDSPTSPQKPDKEAS